MYAIYEGYQGMVEGGDRIRRIGWQDVGGILQLGGTLIGSARCAEFRERSGRLKAAKNLLQNGIDGLVAIGGDGSLTGSHIFREEWKSLLDELVERGEVSAGQAARHPHLQIVGLVGSIDNDMFGTDMTIGADTALHRIVDAIDTITSTAASHHRTFVVEVMGRNCGYLALMSGLATGANQVFIPESPPEGDDWEGDMVQAIRASQLAGRRHSIVIVAEGARDRNGDPLSAGYIKEVLQDRLNADTRITILGHVQRGGSPTAFDRYLSTILGRRAVDVLIDTPADDEPKLVGLRQNRVVTTSLMDSVRQTREVASVIAQRDYDRAMDMRGGSFREALGHLLAMQRARPLESTDIRSPRRLLILHCGGPAPGMNTAVRAATRLALDSGHTVLAARYGFHGLFEGKVEEMDWMSVHGWVNRGGAELGTSRQIPKQHDYHRLGELLEQHDVDMMLIIGGWAGYRAASQIYAHRHVHPRLRLRVCCVPVSINNNLPGSEYSVGTDTALNAIVSNVDKIKQSAVASHRCFIVEVMGRHCGYLALMSAIATGAERVYLPERGISLSALQEDVRRVVEEFGRGKRLGLFIRSENAEAFYTTDFVARLLEKEGAGLYDVRTSVLGHLQQGGDPTPYDRIQATRLVTHAVHHLEGDPNEVFYGAVGLQRGEVSLTNLERFDSLIDPERERPLDQPWLRLTKVLEAMSRQPS
jgi:6-phosphofructokinase 1